MTEEAIAERPWSVAPDAQLLDDFETAMGTASGRAASRQAACRAATAIARRAFDDHRLTAHLAEKAGTPLLTFTRRRPDGDHVVAEAHPGRPASAALAECLHGIAAEGARAAVMRALAQEGHAVDWRGLDLEHPAWLAVERLSGRTAKEGAATLRTHAVLPRVTAGTGAGKRVVVVKKGAPRTCWSAAAPTTMRLEITLPEVVVASLPGRPLSSLMDLGMADGREQPIIDTAVQRVHGDLRSVTLGFAPMRQRPRGSLPETVGVATRTAWAALISAAAEI